MTDRSLVLVPQPGNTYSIKQFPGRFICRDVDVDSETVRLEFYTTAFWTVVATWEELL